MTTISAAEPSRRDYPLVATADAIGAAAPPLARIGQINPDASTARRIVKVFRRSKPIFILHKVRP